MGDEAVRRCRVGAEVVSGSSSTTGSPFSPTTLARPARTRAPSLPGHVVLPESDGPMPFSTRKGAWVGRVPAARRREGERGNGFERRRRRGSGGWGLPKGGCGGGFDRDVVEFMYWRRARGIENGPWGRDWRRGGSAMPRWHGGGLAGAGLQKMK